MRGEKGKTRASSRRTYRQVVANNLDELTAQLRRRDGHLDGNLTNANHIPKAILDQLYAATAHVPATYGIYGRLLVYTGEIDPVAHRCRECLTPLSITTKADLNVRFCSARCSNRNSGKIEHTKATNISRFGVTSNLVQGVISPEKNRLLATGEIPRLWDLGLSRTEIAEQLSISLSYVSASLNRWAAENSKILDGRGVSQVEAKFLDQISTSYDITIERGRRDLIPPLEVDGYIASHRLGIEVNGLYWHSEAWKDKNYHANKTRAAELAGMRLYQFWENEIVERRSLVSAMIGSALGRNETVHARKGQIVVLEAARYREFVDDSHLQGFLPSALRYGIEVDGVLMAAIGLGRPRFNKAHTMEIYRFCTRPGFTVVGGFSKLLKFVSRRHPGTSLLTYADRRFSSQSNVYAKNGFALISVSPPSYFYAKGTTIISRYRAQKHKLGALLGSHDATKSERLLMQEGGFQRVWDAGQYVYSIQL
jgi:very-short-patch-repair endonuclease